MGQGKGRSVAQQQACHRPTKRLPPGSSSQQHFEPAAAGAAAAQSRLKIAVRTRRPLQCTAMDNMHMSANGMHQQRQEPPHINLNSTAPPSAHLVVALVVHQLASVHRHNARGDAAQEVAVVAHSNHAACGHAAAWGLRVAGQLQLAHAWSGLRQPQAQAQASSWGPMRLCSLLHSARACRRLTLKRADRLLQRLLGGDVQVVGGLVQHQKRTLSHRRGGRRSRQGGRHGDACKQRKAGQPAGAIAELACKLALRRHG